MTRNAIVAPSQARSRETMERLLDAAEELLEWAPFEDIGVQEIASRAGVTTGALYARFDGKPGLLRGLEERLHASFGAGLDEELDPDRWAREPLDDLFRALVGRMLAGYRARAPLVRALAREERRDAGAAERARVFNQEKFRAPLERMLMAREDLGGPNAAASIEFALFLLANALTTYALFPETDPIGPRLSDEEFVARLSDALTGYLEGEAS